MSTVLENPASAHTETEAANAGGFLHGPVLPDPGAGQLAAGRIYAVNDSRFVGANYSVPLTAYTAGWSDPDDLDALLERVAPAIDSAERFTFKAGDNAEAYLSETDDIRPLGGNFKRVEYSSREIEGRVFNKGLVIRVDHDEQVGSDWEERYTGYLMRRLVRNDLRRAINGLVQAATPVALTWNADSNPDGDLRRELRAGKSAGGLRPTVALFGGTAWDARAQAYESNTANLAKFMRGSDTPEAVRLRLMLQTLAVSESVYGVGAGPHTDIAGNIVLLYHAQRGVTKDDPSNIKRFVYKTSEGYFRVYVQPFNKYVELTVEHYSREYIVNPSGIRLLNITGVE